MIVLYGAGIVLTDNAREPLVVVSTGIENLGWGFLVFVYL